MAQANVNRVTDAFLLLDYNFSAENFENSFIEKYKAVPKLRKIIEENIRLFAECTANDDTVHTQFLLCIARMTRIMKINGRRGFLGSQFVMKKRFRL